jgi:hypothetical protein
MEKQYVYANIKLPILVNEDDSLEPLVEYLTMEFEECNELPSKPVKPLDYSIILENLKDIIREKSPTNERRPVKENILDHDNDVIVESTKDDMTEQNLYIHPSEILHKKKQKTNMSLKNYRHKKHNFTSANREDIILSMLDTVVDSLPQPMGQEQLQVNDE